MALQIISKRAQILNLMLKITTVVSTAYIAKRTVVVEAKLCGNKGTRLSVCCVSSETPEVQEGIHWIMRFSAALKA